MAVAEVGSSLAQECLSDETLVEIWRALEPGPGDELGDDVRQDVVLMLLERREKGTLPQDIGKWARAKAKALRKEYYLPNQVTTPEGTKKRVRREQGLAGAGEEVASEHGFSRELDVLPYDEMLLRYVKDIIAVSKRKYTADPVEDVMRGGTGIDRRVKDKELSALRRDVEKLWYHRR